MKFERRSREFVPRMTLRGGKKVMVVGQDGNPEGRAVPAAAAEKWPSPPRPLSSSSSVDMDHPPISLSRLRPAFSLRKGAPVRSLALGIGPISIYSQQQQQPTARPNSNKNERKIFI